MSANTGTIDHALRAAPGLLALALGLVGRMPPFAAPLVGYRAAAIAVVMPAMAAPRMCPLDGRGGLQTCKGC